jgi:hypothetical protein
VSVTGRRRWTIVGAALLAAGAAAACSSSSAHPPATGAIVATMPALSAPPSRAVPSRSSRPSPRPTPAAPSPIYRLPADALLVGPGHKYAKPCQAIAAAKPGATIGIDAKGNGTYNGDVCAWSIDRLTIAGFNGMAHIDAAGRNAQGKATWVIAGDHTTIRDVELSGSAVPDNNGAGIRQEGAGLTVIDCHFHDNQDGILAGDNPASDIVIEDSEFARNGAGDGYSHNMYINHVRSFTLEGSWSHDARVGHLVKSRALVNHILYNRITGQGGTDSYEIDLPNGGLSDVIGNVIEQGKATQNPGMLSYGEEGSLNPDSRLNVVGNTFVNDLGHGPSVAVGSAVSVPVTVLDNVSVGSSTLVSQAGAVLHGNCVTANPKFVRAASYNYRLAAGSPCLNIGVPPRSDLTPTREYAQPTSTRSRPTIGRLDAGAFECG